MEKILSGFIQVFFLLLGLFLVLYPLYLLVDLVIKMLTMTGS